MIKYIIVKPELNLSSYERAKKISRALYLLQRPIHIQFEYEKEKILFGVIKHPDGRGALEFDENYILKIHPEATAERLVALFPDVTADERYLLSSFLLTSNNTPFKNIIPSTVTVRDDQYMIQDGWLPDPSEI